MKFSIVVTRFNEPEEICRPLFDSIKVQEGFDFTELEVIVVNDGKDNLLPVTFFQGYPFKIEYHSKDHEGVSAARNYGLDLAKGEYVMFCDCDDAFASMFALNQYYKAVCHTPYDLVTTSFVEEQIRDGQFVIIRHDKDITFNHGKFYRIDYLNEIGLRFNPNLTIHEDGYFNSLANLLTENKYEITMALYIWKWNPNSTVRRDSEDYVLKTYKELMDCRIAICEKLWEKEDIQNYFRAVAKTVIDSYYDFQKPNALKPENAKIVDKAKKSFKRFYNKFKKDYLSQNINDIADMMYVCRMTAYGNGLRVEQQTITEFLTEIVNL